MANKLLTELLELPRPKDLTQDDLKLYLDQLNIFEPGTKEFGKIEKTFTDLGYKIPPNYLGVVISNWYENFTEIPKYEQTDQTETPVYQTAPDKITLEQFGEEFEKREQQKQETVENSKRAVKEAQQKLREIKTRNDEISKRLEEQKGKKLGVKINFQEERPLTNESDIKPITENVTVETVDNSINPHIPEYVPHTYNIATTDSSVKKPEAVKKGARFTPPETLLQSYKKEDTEVAIEKVQQKLRETVSRNDEVLKGLEEQKGKKLYVEIKSPAEEQFTEEEALDFENYKNSLLSIKPEEIQEKLPEEVKKLAQKMENRIGESLKKQGLDEDDIKLVTEDTATEIIETIVNSEQENYIPTSHYVAVTNTFEKHPEEIAKITPNKETQGLIRENIRDVSAQAQLQVNIYREFTERSFGKKFARGVFGPKPEDLAVNISETPQPTYTETYTPYAAVRSAQMSLENQDQNLEELKQRGLEEGKRVLIRDTRSLIRKRLELIHPQSGAGRFLQSNKGEYFLRAFGVGPQDGLSLVEKIGVDYGIGITAGARMAIRAKATTQTALSIANTGGIMQMEAYLGGAGTAASQATGQAAGKVATNVGIKAGLGGLLAKGAAALGVSLGAFTFGVSTVITIMLTAVGKILEKIDWTKVKRWLKDNGWILGLGAVAINPWVGIGLAAGIYGLTRQVRLAAIGAAIWGFLLAIGSAFVMAVATPVIITLVVLPPLVAFMMFIINSGAYLVPPKPVAESGFGPGGGGYYCTTVKEPSGITSSVNSPIATRALHIVEDLYQGFWCFWNRSPSNNPPPDGPPRADFPDDAVLYPLNYPDLFNYDLFKQSPNGDPTGGNDLFWCTWLVQKAYTENGVSIANTLWSPDMKLDFENRGKFVPASSVTSLNAVPGSVIFFDVDNEKDRIDHVGIIYTTNGDDVTYVQSNAGLKAEHLTLGSNGLQGKPGYIDVIGIGLP